MTDWQLFTARSVRLPQGVVGDAVLIESGRVAAIGEAEELRARTAGKLHEIPYADGVILPGIRDSHLHPVAYTALLTGTPLRACESLQHLKSILRTAAAGTTGAINAFNLDEGSLREKRLPIAADLDDAVADRPVLVHRYDGHLAIVNSQALRLAGIDGSTADPAGGVIDRDESGNPTGVLRENAIDLVTSAPGVERRVEVADIGGSMRALAAIGITSIGAMIRTGIGPWAHLGDEADLMAAATPDIPIRIRAYLTADTLANLDRAAAMLDAAGPTMSWAGVKRFADGSFGSCTAAMHAPFADHPGTGTMRLDDLDVAMARHSIAAGGSVAIHAIGDAAASRVLDVFADLSAEGVEGHRLRMEHASLLTADDIGRIGEMGAVASVQPAFLGTETDWIESRVGPVRLQRTYAYRSLLAAGALVVGGSDSPVESPDPWEAMALTRDRAGLVMAEALTATEALAMYTTTAAQALGEPVPLAAGSPADLTIVDRDPIEVSPNELRDTEVLATVVGGAVVDVSGAAPWWIDG